MTNYKMLPVRIIALPFVFALALLYSLYKLAVFTVNFLVYGGEFIVLSKKMDRKKIIDVFDGVEVLIGSKNSPT